jgi:hypothetical protein
VEAWNKRKVAAHATSQRVDAVSGRAASRWVLAVAVVLSGCARVAPYQRGTLARSDMELGENPDLAAGEEHGLAYREGSSGGGAAKGGGCGCN